MHRDVAGHAERERVEARVVDRLIYKANEQHFYYLLYVEPGLVSKFTFMSMSV